jgi:hypothetical protein
VDGVHVHTRRVPPEAFAGDRVAQPERPSRATSES